MFRSYEPTPVVDFPRMNFISRLCVCVAFVCIHAFVCANIHMCVLEWENITINWPFLGRRASTQLLLKVSSIVVIYCGKRKGKIHMSTSHIYLYLISSQVLTVSVTVHDLNLFLFFLFPDFRPCKSCCQWNGHNDRHAKVIVTVCDWVNALTIAIYI